MDSTMAFLMPRKEDSTTLVVLKEYLAKVGIPITREDALMLCELRSESLEEHERVEFGKPAVIFIAEELVGSAFLTKECAAETLAQIQRVFYRIRDELPVNVPDAEIIEALSACLDEFGNAADVAEMPLDELMAFLEDYTLSLVVEDSAIYRLADDEGREYVFDATDWDYDEYADGWDGEKWADDWND